MARIFTIGETVYDIIFKENNPVEGRPGGAMLNTSVSLARLNTPVNFISGCADDRLGQIIIEFLNNNKVNTDFVSIYDDARSRIALAFLDDARDAAFSFYKIHTNEKNRLRFPEAGPGDIILFGSYYSIKQEIRSEIHEFLSKSRQNGALLIYDPNFRKAHLNILDEVRGSIEENIRLAHLVKGSNEDFFHIYGTCDEDSTWGRMQSNGSEIMIYTKNKNGVYLFRNEYRKHFSVPKIDPVSTVGAGDSFNAGLIWALYSMNVDSHSLYQLKNSDWDEVIRIASEFGTHSCLSFDNYISYEFAEKYMKST